MRAHVALLILAFCVRSTHHEASVSYTDNNNDDDNLDSNNNINGNHSGTANGETEFPKRGYNEPCTCDSDCDFGKW